MKRRSFQVLFALSVFTLAGKVEAESCWIEAVPPQPLAPYRYNVAALSYDSIRQVTVMFQWDVRINVGRTFEWDGEAWNERASGVGPSRRERFNMTFDEARGVTVLFGGYEAGTEFGDTWTWDGNVWTQVSNAGPSARYGHAMGYDKQRNVVVLFGGLGEQPVNDSYFYNDTWEWNGTNWSPISATGPAPRRLSAMAYDETNQKMILFGGYQGTVPVETYHGDTWSWDGSNWTQLATSGPAPRQQHAMTFDGSLNRVVLFGGEVPGQGPTSETWSWDGTAWVQLASGGPPTRYAHGLVYEPSRNRTLLFGGYNGFMYFDDTWVWDGASWTERAPIVPSSHSHGAGLAYDKSLGVTVLFGGGVGNFGTTFYGTNRIWHWDGSAWSLTPPIPYYEGPGDRRWLAMAYDEARENIVLDGGRMAGPSSGGSAWKFDGFAWADLGYVGSGTTVKDHAMVYDSIRQRVVLVRKKPAGPQATETWEYDGASWSLKSSTGPLPRAKHALAFDSSRGVTVLFGGESTQSLGNFGDTWEWDGATWTQRSSTGPSPRSHHAMVYDEQLGKTVLFGGNSGTLSGETWTWDGTIWEQLVIPGPPARDQHRMSYDPGRNRIVMFGGKPTEADTWEFAANCDVVPYARFLPVQLGDPGEVSAIRVTLKSLHHVSPPYTAGAATDFSSFEGQMRWVGPPTQNVESTGSGVPIYTAPLQCTPYYQDWSTIGFLHMTGSAIVPSSEYEVSFVDASCQGNEANCTAVSAPLTRTTARWADVEASYSVPGGPAQPDFGDVAALLNKFKSAPGAPGKSRALLAGTDAFGNINASPDLDFSHISACVDAFKGRPYPYAIQTCP